MLNKKKEKEGILSWCITIDCIQSIMQKKTERNDLFLFLQIKPHYEKKLFFFYYKGH